jgi:hypothetical protein
MAAKMAVRVTAVTMLAAAMMTMPGWGAIAGQLRDTAVMLQANVR